MCGYRSRARRRTHLAIVVSENRSRGAWLQSQSQSQSCCGSDWVDEDAVAVPIAGTSIELGEGAIRFGSVDGLGEGIVGFEPAGSASAPDRDVEIAGCRFSIRPFLTAGFDGRPTRP